MVDDNRLPCFQRLIEQGSIASLDVTGQPATVVWAGMMTGRLPSEHGIYGDFEVRPDGGGIQPCGAASWRAAPVWEMLAQNQVATAILALPGTWPATAWKGSFAIDERFATAPLFDTLDWPLAPDCIEPAALRSRYRELRLDSEDIDPEHVGPLPLRALAYAATVQGLALERAVSSDWRFLAAHYPALGDSDEAYRFMDMAVERLLAATGGKTDLLIASSTGMMMACGPSFSPDRLLHGIRSIDVAATILSLFSLELENSAGRSFASDIPKPTKRVTGARPSRELPATVPQIGSEAQRAIDQVVEQRLRIEVREAILIWGAAAAMPLVRSALVRLPGDLEFQLALGHGAVARGDAETCLTLGQQLKISHPDLAWADLLTGAGLALTEDIGADTYLANAADRGAGDAGVLIHLGAIALQRDKMTEARGRYTAALKVAERTDLRAQALTGLGLASLDDAESAEKHLRAALGLAYGSAAVHHQLGLLLARQSRWVDAIAALRQAVSLAPQATDFQTALRHAEAALTKAIALRR